MKRIIINTLCIVLLFLSGTLIFVFSQEDTAPDGTNIVDIAELTTFDTFYEYPAESDKYATIGDADLSMTSTDRHYKAMRVSERELTISYYDGAIQKQHVSKIPYRNINKEELRYIDNERYERPFTVIRYTLFSDATGTKVQKKELIDENGNPFEYYEFSYNNESGVVEKMEKYSLSPFLAEFRVYETAEFYYGDGAADTSGMQYYNVMDGKGTVKFTYSIPPTYFTGSGDGDLSSVTEIFVQYKDGVDKEDAVISKTEEGELNIEFDAKLIQYVIASSETADFIFNGDGSLRQALLKEPADATVE